MPKFIDLKKGVSKQPALAFGTYLIKEKFLMKKLVKFADVGLGHVDAFG